MFHVVFVCIGNVCRSPLAERLLVHRLDERGVGGAFRVSSLGLQAQRGQPMHPESRADLEALGGSAEGFGSRPMSEREVSEAGLVLTATRDVRTRVLSEVPRALRRSFTVMEFAALARAAGTAPSPEDLVLACAARRSDVAHEDLDVPDPINRSREVFADAAARLDASVTAIADALARHAATADRP